MSNYLTPMMNERSVEQVRGLIKQKTSDHPYFATNQSVLPIVNDMDHHPYTRWYRGVYYYPDPIVMEREAGWRKQRNACYDINIPPQKVHRPNHCFEAPCSTIFPCYPEYLTKFSDRENLDVMINNACIVQYR